MQRQRGGLVHIGEAIVDLPGPVPAIRNASPQAQHHFTQADQVNPLVTASEVDPDLGFMARMMALCSLPRTNPGNRHQYKRVNGPYKLIMIAGGDNKLPYGKIIRHPVPLDMNTLTALKRSSLGLDLYLWLTYRTFALRAPLRLTWRQVYRQFGAHPAQADDKNIVNNFRTKCLRELKKIKLAWPGLNYATALGVLILHPATPVIPPSDHPQLAS